MTPQPGAGADAKRSYKDTLNLPKTAFAMKANLVQNEPASMKRWAALDAGRGLYAALTERRRAAGAPLFAFHDGPPYANGSIHLGHLLNKCMKDFVVRSRSMTGPMGMLCPFVPGWDCHGLPIEHKVMSELVESKKIDKLNTLGEDQRKTAIRRECQKYAEKFVKLHIGQMTRLLTLADYENPYLTLTPSFEGATLEVLASLVEQRLVYRALKPVHWSIANQTALAEAELEYYDREDLSVYVDFEADDSDAVYDAFGLPRSAAQDEEEDQQGARPEQRPSFMIWTTTPWTLPANVGVAVNPRHEYALVRIDGNVTVLAASLVEKVARLAKAEDVQVLATAPGEKLLGLRYRHPFVTSPPACGLGRSCDPMKLWSLVAADYVTLDDGTGLVHTAPGHGDDDYASGLREHLPIYNPVRADGTYDDTVPDWLRGLSVWDANTQVTDWLRESGHLFHSHTFTHSYPHDWRSKTPTIFRCTEQWFLSVDGARGGSHGSAKNLRALALAAIDEANPYSVKFYPAWARNRLRGMVESRPDWCISRQRAWGLPIPAFRTAEGDGGAMVMTAAIARAVAKLFRESGTDVWFAKAPEDLLKHYDETADPELPALLKPLFARGKRDALRKGPDILDVWFESGSTWHAVMRERGLGFPSELYLEGSDQHRGWFQSSLLPALGVTGTPPYKAILTHGFTVDRDGRKLSKSSGDSVDDLMARHGSDVLRWWTCAQAYENDMKADGEIFELAGESYRKVRNTLRFLLSNLHPDDYTPSGDQASRAAEFEPTGIDAWALAEFDALRERVLEGYAEYDFKRLHGAVYDFCNITMSSIYLAAVKDRLYCDRVDSARRRRTQKAMWRITDGLCRLLAPVLPHTADEAYRTLHNADPKSPEPCVHLTTFPPAAGVPADPGWPRVMAVIDDATKTLEHAKLTTGVENPLEAGVRLPDPDGTLARFDRTDLADLLGVSRVELGGGNVEVIDLRSEPRCERSWKRDGTVRVRSDGGVLSDRDAEAIGVA